MLENKVVEFNMGNINDIQRKEKKKKKKLRQCSWNWDMDFNE